MLGVVNWRRSIDQTALPTRRRCEMTASRQVAGGTVGSSDSIRHLGAGHDAAVRRRPTDRGLPAAVLLHRPPGGALRRRRSQLGPGVRLDRRPSLPQLLPQPSRRVDGRRRRVGRGRPARLPQYLDTQSQRSPEHPTASLPYPQWPVNTFRGVSVDFCHNDTIILSHSGIERCIIIAKVARE